ncbi:hypothetical protein CAMRE0001_1207 [Campylobacter rectus RM3267]|uniref:Uncharacterized protein n=1 Tax=Campylobacter rectus RM3267 TaxID=553218 RepID=B9D0K2_CAMRE|nr:hypothetical protein CAMRE0001_1207 [Campylobacter rectus RM3267]
MSLPITVTIAFICRSPKFVNLQVWPEFDQIRSNSGFKF